MAGKQIHMAIVYFTEIEQGKLLKLHLSSHGYLQGLLLEWNQTENGLVRKYLDFLRNIMKPLIL
jgi:hypothetical protein